MDEKVAEAGSLDNWIDYSDALINHVEETRCAIHDGREWDAFEAIIEIPEIDKRYL